MAENKCKIRLIAFSSSVCRQAGPFCQTLGARRIWPLSALERFEKLIFPAPFRLLRSQIHCAEWTLFMSS